MVSKWSENERKFEDLGLLTFEDLVDGEAKMTNDPRWWSGGTLK